MRVGCHGGWSSGRKALGRGWERITLVPIAAAVAVMVLVVSAADRILAYILHGTTSNGLLPGALMLVLAFLLSLVVVLAYAGSNLLDIAYSAWIFMSELVFGAVLFLFVVSSWISAPFNWGKPLHPGLLILTGTALLIGLFVYSEGASSAADPARARATSDHE